MNRTFEKVVNRAADFTGSYGHTRTAPERSDALALAALAAKAADQQLELFARWCYEQAIPGGAYAHIMADGQIPTRAWTPWSKTRGELTRTEGRIVRRWLLTMQQGRHFPLWFYRKDSRRWYVDLTRYDDLTDALDWLKRHPIHPQDWWAIRSALLGRQVGGGGQG